MYKMGQESGFADRTVRPATDYKIRERRHVEGVMGKRRKRKRIAEWHDFDSWRNGIYRIGGSEAVRI